MTTNAGAILGAIRTLLKLKQQMVEQIDRVIIDLESGPDSAAAPEQSRKTKCRALAPSTELTRRSELFKCWQTSAKADAITTGWQQGQPEQWSKKSLARRLHERFPDATAESRERQIHDWLKGGASMACAIEQFLHEDMERLRTAAGVPDLYEITPDAAPASPSD
jgi:hypothetical protein